MNAMKDPNKFFELDVIEDQAWWMNYIRGVSFNGVEYMLNEDLAITDVGTSCVYMPQLYYDTFMSYVLDGVSSHDGYIRCQDVTKLPKIELNFGNYWFEFNPEDYAIRQVYNCFVCILPQELDMWILGSSFLRGYYTTHDLTTNKFGFAVHKTSNKNHPRQGAPANQLDKLVKTDWASDNKGKLILIVIGSILGVVGLAVALYFLMKKDESAARIQIIKF